MKPACADQRPYIPITVQRPLPAPGFALAWPHNASSSSPTSSMSSNGLVPGFLVSIPAGGLSSHVGLQLPVGPLRKRDREPLSPHDAQTSALRGDPEKFTQAFRENLRTASEMPAGSLAGLVRNLVAQRAGDGPLPRGELHGLMDVLVEERGGLSTEDRCHALQGLVAGLGGTGMSAALQDVLVRRVLCMGVGHSIQPELRTITSALVRGEGRLERLQGLVDRVMNTSLDLAGLKDAMASIVQGLRAASASPKRIDAELQDLTLKRILKPTPERSSSHIAAALEGLKGNSSASPAEDKVQQESKGD